MQRPMPPQMLTDLGAEGFRLDAFVPAPEVAEWARAMFIEDGGPLENEDHAHLKQADIGVLWTNAGNSRGGKIVVGTAELGMPMIAAGKWLRARVLQQITEWFGDVPDFIVTLSAGFCAQCTDTEFCAIVEHELYHCGQEHDRFGAPRFSRDTGRPKFAIQAHDVEEFVGVVRRYGAEATRVQAMVEAAKEGPTVGPAAVAGACGTCLKAVA